MTSISTLEPSVIYAGDTVQWIKRVDGYLSTDGWSLKYRLLSKSGSIALEGTGQADGSWLLRAEPATTAAWVPDWYGYTYSVDNATDRFSWPNVGYIEIRLDPQIATEAQETRSWAARTLEAVEAVLESRASKDQQSYSIAGRSLTRMDVAELMDWRDRLRGEVAREADAERIAKGLPKRNKIRAVLR